MKRRPALKTLLLFLLGILLGRHVELPPAWLLTGAVLAASFALLLWLNRRAAANLVEVGLALGVILGGALRYEFAAGYFPYNHISRFDDLRKEVMVSGVVCSYPEKRRDRVKLTVEATALRTESDSLCVRGKILVTLHFRRPAFRYGDEVQIRGHLRKPSAPRNPGEFDYRAYLNAQGVFALMSVRDPKHIQRLSAAHGAWLLRKVVFPAKRYLDVYIHRHLPPPEAALLQGLLVGERGEISTATRDAFARLGVIHVLAVSGLHVGFIVLIFMGVVGFFRIPRGVRVAVTLVGLLFYAYLINLKPPVVRASLMGGLLLVATVLERRTDVFNTLALAALVILLINPLELFQSGFQLSFAAVAAIVYLYPRFRRLGVVRALVAGRLHSVVRYPVELLLVSLAAFCGTLPFTIMYFHRLPFYALFANLLVIPLAFCGLANGITAALANLLLPAVGTLFAQACWFFLHILLALVRWAGALPGATVEVYRFALWHAFAYFLGLALLCNLDRRSLRVAAVAAVFLLANLYVWRDVFGGGKELEVAFLDVGQGDAALVRFPDGRYMLIDGGPRTQGYDAGSQVILPYLRRQGVKELAAVALSHGDSDHIGGVPYLLRHFPVHEVWDNGKVGDTDLFQEYVALVDSLGIKRRTLTAGDLVHSFEPAEVCVLHPPARVVDREDVSENDASLCLKVTFGQMDFLFLGDIEAEGEAEIAEFGPVLASEVLKVSHHGSRTSTSAALLQRVKPQVAVISVGEWNKFGHPSPQVLARLAASGARIHRTDREGAVIFKTDGRRLSYVRWH